MTRAAAPSRSKSEVTYRKRRDAAARRLLKDASGRKGIALFFSGSETGLDRFEPDPSFYYLTGIDGPDAVLLFLLTGDKAQEMLLLRPSDPGQERWTGKVLAAGGQTPSAEPDAARRRAMRETGARNIAASYELDAALVRPLRDAELVYLDFPVEGLGAPIGTVHGFYERLRSRCPHLEVRHGGRIVAELRRIKGPEELALMDAAMAITDEAHAAILRHLAPGMYEFEVQAILEYVFRVSGAESCAFPSIIGSGPNSCVLHYSKNDRRMGEGDLVVCDIGCRKDYYCADITRTLPVSGRFTRRQAKVYETVLAAHDAAIAAARPGVQVKDVHKAAYDYIKQAGFEKYFFHGTSHYLGIEAHDVGSYDPPLEPGVVITVEPGIYIASENIGVRIEDDVVITEDGARLMTHAPRTVADIEKAMSTKRKQIVI